MKVMIVEDDPVSLTLLEKMIQKTDAMVITASNGVTAWEAFNKERPRIVVSDWMLPELSGIELCRKIRESQTTAYTYIIIMTAKDRKEDALTAFDAGADDFVPKPYQLRELQARMHTGWRIIDLEDKHQALQQTLIDSRAKFRTIFDALHEEIISVDRDINLTSINKAASTVMQGDYSDVIGRPCCRVADPAEASFYEHTIREMVEKGFDTGRAAVYLDRFGKDDGKETIKERTVVPVIDEQGRVQTVTIVSRDITEAHQRNEEIQGLNHKLKKISSELIRKNLKLESTLKNLERTQAQMVQSEKMASIGQLAAGVAHEINNPTGFVSSNLKTLGDYQKDMNRLIGDYQKLRSELKGLPDGLLPATVVDLIAQVDATEEDVDIAYIQEDVGDLIGDCREGTERIKRIVEDLKHFAHPGEDRMKETDINAGIESTLNVVNNELKYKATIVKELGDIPIIHGYPQQLNQVFMNILVNAAHAIEKSGEIKIVTASIDDKVEIRISDTGCGISEENITKIFDPFFTTKDVGKGTGLGMNIAYNIIAKHKGHIHVESKVGEGTTFIVQLPVGALQETADAASEGKAFMAQAT
ncbi:response regulator [uncultured Desulfosarcina sp.]|uniref:response regulator n=1 Tax=uncultured Desulfosarcina sp. TaxID=218289 RepID=UPI0029C7AA4A|nr:response regulator [uncultured Desulfosarcina sp.]